MFSIFSIILTNSVLFSPLEGFKSFAYVTHLAELSETFPLNSWFVNVHNFAANYSVSIYDFLVLALLFQAFALAINYNSEKDTNYIGKTLFFTLVVSFPIVCMSLSSFVYTYIEFTDLGEKAAQLTMFTEVKNILFFTIKDILSFFSIAFLVYLLSNSSFSASKLIPQGTLEIFGETVYKISLGFFANTLGLKHEKEVKQYQELFLKVHGILIFILGANVGGMLPYSTTITSSLSNTLFIALAIFINIIIIFLKEKGLTTFLSLFMPSGCPLALAFLLVPIEFLSYFFRVLSLSVRLFANMMAGHTLLKVIAGFSWSFIVLGDYFVILHYAPFLVLFILTVLEIAVAFIQTYIFVTLSYFYLRDLFVGH